jgi:hypothetical protein
MFKDFGRRLQRDVKHIVDGRIANSETASGSHMRVSVRVRLGPEILSSIYRASADQYLYIS